MGCAVGVSQPLTSGSDNKSLSIRWNQTTRMEGLSKTFTAPACANLIESRFIGRFVYEGRCGDIFRISGTSDSTIPARNEGLDSPRGRRYSSWPSASFIP